MLFVANADANNIAVFNVAKPGNAKPLGFIPAGWYPTSVRYNRRGQTPVRRQRQGTTPQANPARPQPAVAAATRPFGSTSAGLFRGTLEHHRHARRPQQMADLQQAGLCVQPAPRRPGRDGQAARRTTRSRQRSATPSPIKHCIYIIKENRTYDQVFGDMKEGNGDPKLCLFPEKITPNHHKLAREFVLLDNFYVRRRGVRRRP